MCKHQTVRLSVFLLIACFLVGLVIGSPSWAATPYDNLGVMWSYQEAEQRYDGSGNLIAPNNSNRNNYGEDFGLGTSGAYVNAWVHDVNALGLPTMFGQQSTNGQWHNVFGLIDRYGQLVWGDDGGGANNAQMYSSGVEVVGDKFFNASWPKFAFDASQTYGGNTDLLILQYNADGTRGMVKQIYGTTDPAQTVPLDNKAGERLQDISIDSSGNIYLGGVSNAGLLEGIAFPSDLADTDPATPSNGAGQEPYVLKYDSAGNFIEGTRWNPTVGTVNKDGMENSYMRTYDIQVATDGSVFVSGRTNGYISGETNAGGDDIYMAKLNPDLSVAWEQQMGGIGRDNVDGITLDVDENGDENGNAYFVGYVANDQHVLTFDTKSKTLDLSDGYIRKVDSDGNLLWERTIDGGPSTISHTFKVGSDYNVVTGDVGSSIDYLRNAVFDEEGNLWVVGKTTGKLGDANAGGFDPFMMKLDPDTGDTLQVLQWGTAYDDDTQTLDIDGMRGKLFVSGATMGEYPNAGPYPYLDNPDNADITKTNHNDFTLQKIAAGDFNNDGLTDWDDMRIAIAAVEAGPLPGDETYDFDEDGDSDADDVTFFMEEIFESTYGDFDFDGAIDQDDYDLLDGVLGEDWEPGDPGVALPLGTWRGFTGPISADLIDDEEWDYLYDASAAVPEPSTLLLMGLGCLGFLAFRRRRR